MALNAKRVMALAAGLAMDLVTGKLAARGGPYAVVPFNIPARVEQTLASSPASPTGLEGRPGL